MEAFQTRLQLRLQAATTVSESNMPKELTAIIEREGNGYVALCPELDVVSQGDTVIEARSNVREALELFLETASETEIEQRFRS
ncbi:MAG: type II toxin-antitoxin system HicB family antitoxin [Bryobacterales bacterium]|nr:type II toxin-antitoxin system HicB family antitoxin [Bryobacterales bacterium]